jgi:DHA1 family tetracycline resistance protein-like MFS transporter
VTGLASIVGPLSLSQTLAFFSGPQAPVHFPGAAFLLAALLAFVAWCILLSRLRTPFATAVPAAGE